MNPELQRLKLDRTVRGLWLAVFWIAAIIALGALVDAIS